MQPTRSGIPTTFRRANFRSRLEARWAAFFDLVGWQWTYEPVDVSGYIPDFLVHGRHPFYVEVGPCVTPADYVAKIDKPDRAAAQLGLDVLVVGVSPLPAFESDGQLVAGLLGELFGHVPGEVGCWGTVEFPCATEDHVLQLAWGPAIWGCGLIAQFKTLDELTKSMGHAVMDELGSPLGRCLGVFHGHQGFHHRPHGEAHEAAAGPAHRRLIEDLWNEAGSRVQWRAAS